VADELAEDQYGKTASGGKACEGNIGKESESNATGLQVRDRVDTAGQAQRMPPEGVLHCDPFVTQPQDELDKIYVKALENSVSPHCIEQEKEELYATLRETLGSIVILLLPFTALSLARLLHMPISKVDWILANLHSILDIPKDPSCPIGLHHPSLRDFLLDQQRCGDTRFWIDEKKANEALANRCIQLMTHQLKRDICSLRAPGVCVKNVQVNKIEQCFPAELQYACVYWVRHLQASETVLSDNDHVHVFLCKHLLHWIEALGLIGKISEGVRAINLLESMVKVSIPNIIRQSKTNLFNRDS
jgi:hypothetical protein